jgi:DNA-binding NarL/FixJ family response regulator
LTGEEEVCLAKELIPDIILIDIQLPGMDGLKAIHKMKCGTYFIGRVFRNTQKIWNNRYIASSIEVSTYKKNCYMLISHLTFEGISRCQLKKGRL